MQMTLMNWHVVIPELLLFLIIIIIRINDVIEISEKAFSWFRVDRFRSLWLDVCDNVVMKYQIKGTDRDTWEQGERFVISMHMPGSDDSGTDMVWRDSNTDKAS